MDYLEAKYPTPSLMPQEAQALAKVRMVEMITVNEIQPATPSRTSPNQKDFSNSLIEKSVVTTLVVSLIKQNH
ncbi:hypothetical protein [Floridanema evergladense]|uniref:Uncharacterized protein n=1 Tax=Floridaenema evergladense BLCC-F167 TaxID=3153639 RepID=A0ABV4WX55_9CYAN